MMDTERTKEQLLDELAQLRQRVQELDRREEECTQQAQVAHQQLIQEQIARLQAQRSLQAVVQDLNTLQERQYFLEKLTQMSSALLYLFDAIEERNIYINARSLDLLGYTPETVLAMGAGFMTQRMHPEDLAQMPAYFEQLAKSPKGSFCELEYRMLHANGEWRWFSSRETVFSRTPDGKIHQILGTAQDITDRKNIEAALQESRSLFDNFINHAPIAAYIKDKDGRYLYVKPPLEQLNQYEVTDLIGKTDFDLFTAEIAERLRANDVAILANGQATQVPETIEVEGKKRYFTSFKFSFRTASGQQVLAGISIDITALEQAEVALRESQLLYQTLAEALPNLVWTLTPDGTIDYANQQWREALGVTIEEVNQAGWGLIVHPDELPQSLENWARIQAGAGITEQEYRHRMADGSYRWFLARLVVIRNEQEQLVRIVGASTDIDERKRMEDALRSSEERLSLASQAAKVGTFEWNLQTNKVFWTAEEEALYGLPRGGFQGKFEHWKQAVHPDDRDRAEQDVLNAVASRSDLNNEFRIVHLDGSVRWMAAKGRVFYDSENRPLRMVGMNEDITDRKQLEVDREELLQQLETNLRQFEAVINSMSEGLLVSDAQGNVLLFNPAALVLHEYDSVEQVRRHLYEFPDTFEGQDAWGNFIPLAEWPLGRVLRGETYRDYEINVHRLDTGTRWVGSFSGTPVYDKQGKMILAIVTMHDIRDRKQTEEALRQSEERYRSLAELIPQLVWTANAEGVLMDVNQRWSTFTGLTLAQAQTEGWGAVVHADDVPILGQNWAIAQQSGTHYQAEGRMRRADGVYRWHLHQAVPLKDEWGQVVKWFGTATDIEDQKQLEQQRLHLLRQEQVAREQAETANRIKDEFLAVLSHELRTPLNPILGWTKLLRSRKLDSLAAERALDTIERNAKLQAQLIEDLLDVSRILQGKVALNICPVNLVTTIEAALETVRLSAEAKGVQIQTLLDLEVGQVNGDANRLQQILWNLLSNAVKFTPSGGCVKVRLEQTGIYAQIQVSDTGRGISPDFLPCVFEYFRQADSSTTRQFGGLGLGLAIVRHLVELHGGTVKAESPGQGMGATFTVHLPLILSVLTPDLEVLPTQETNNLNGICILIVDDEADMRDLIRFILEEQGATVRVATSALEALQHFAASTPDVLISDIGMPEMDGYALIQQIRATLSEPGKMIPAIALTAYAGDINQRQALEAGFQLHLAKPIEPEQLVKTVAKLVARSSNPKQ